MCVTVLLLMWTAQLLLFNSSRRNKIHLTEQCGVTVHFLVCSNVCTGIKVRASMSHAALSFFEAWFSSHMHFLSSENFKKSNCHPELAQLSPCQQNQNWEVVFKWTYTHNSCSRLPSKRQTVFEQHVVGKAVADWLTWHTRTSWLYKCHFSCSEQNANFYHFVLIFPIFKRRRRKRRRMS